MEGVIVEDSDLSNTVVFPDSEVSSATITNSIIGTSATIRDVELRDNPVG